MAEKITLRRIARQQIAHIHTCSPKAIYCSECGEAIQEYKVIEEKKCGACEHIIQPTDQFCWHCGEELIDNGTTQYFDDESELTEIEFAKSTKVGKKARTPIMRYERGERKEASPDPSLPRTHLGLPPEAL